MKKIFTLIAAALFIMPGTVEAQKKFVHESRQPLARMAKLKSSGSGSVAPKESSLALALKAQPRVLAEGGSLYMPLQEDIYYYEGDWVYSGVYNYTYDSKGNVLGRLYGR